MDVEADVAVAANVTGEGIVVDAGYDVRGGADMEGVEIIQGFAFHDTLASGPWGPPTLMAKGRTDKRGRTRVTWVRNFWSNALRAKCQRSLGTQDASLGTVSDYIKPKMSPMEIQEAEAWFATNHLGRHTPEARAAMDRVLASLKDATATMNRLAGAGVSAAKAAAGASAERTPALDTAYGELRAAMTKVLAALPMAPSQATEASESAEASQATEAPTDGNASRVRNGSSSSVITGTQDGHGIQPDQMITEIPADTLSVMDDIEMMPEPIPGTGVFPDYDHDME